MHASSCTARYTCSRFWGLRGGGAAHRTGALRACAANKCKSSKLYWAPPGQYGGRWLERGKCGTILSACLRGAEGLSEAQGGFFAGHCLCHALNTCGMERPCVAMPIVAMAMAVPQCTHFTMWGSRPSNGVPQGPPVASHSTLILTRLVVYLWHKEKQPVHLHASTPPHHAYVQGAASRCRRPALALAGAHAGRPALLLPAQQHHPCFGCIRPPSTRELRRGWRCPSWGCLAPGTPTPARSAPACTQPCSGGQLAPPAARAHTWPCTHRTPPCTLTAPPHQRPH